MSHLLSCDGIEYRIASDTDSSEVQSFMLEHAKRSYECEPPPSTGILLGAWKDGVVVGSVAMDFSENNEPFPLEEIYEPEAFHALFPEGFDRSRIVQAGRWFSALKGSSISRALLQAMSNYVISRGRRLVLGEGKPYSIKLFQKFNYTCSFVPEHRPNLQAIPGEGRRYYEVDPPPCLFRLDL